MHAWMHVRTYVYPYASGRFLRTRDFPFKGRLEEGVLSFIGVRLRGTLGDIAPLNKVPV